MGIVNDKIEISDALGMDSLSDFQMEVVPNEHARAKITGIITDETLVSQWRREQDDRKVTVYCNIEENREILFYGLIHNAYVEYANHIKMLTIELISYSSVIDREVKNKSFQNINTAYIDTIKSVAESDGEITCFAEGVYVQKPEKPVIQYRETNWQFIKRLSSHLGVSVFADVSKEIPSIWIGYPQSTAKAVLKEDATYKHGISSRYFEVMGAEAEIEKSQFEYYVVDGYENLNIGQDVSYNGQSFKVTEKSARLIRSELIFSYKLTKKGYIIAKKVYNPVFAGMTILGNIIDVSGENVKLHLDIDKEQDVGSAYFYSWAPDTGSVMYCMPEKGTTVALYFSDEDEFTAKAVSCVRHNGESCSKMADSNKRTLTTDGGKNLYLNPDSVGLDVEETGLKFDISDEDGVSVNSAKKIYIFSEKEIKMTGKNVYMDSPTEVVVTRQ